MNAARTRPLTMVDLMVLIAASAVGLTVFKLVVQSLLGGGLFWDNLTMAPSRGWTAGQVLVRVVQWIAPSLPFAASWTFTLPILRLRPPRPGARRMLRQPGTMACVAAILGLLWALAALGGTLAVMQAVHGRLTCPPQVWLFHFVVEELFEYVGLAVAAAWFAQWLSGRWRPVPDWIDRFGRMLGAYWVMVGLAWGCRRYLEIVVF